MRKNLRLIVPVLCGLMLLQQAAKAQQSPAAASPSAAAAVTPAMRREANEFYTRQDWAGAAKAYEAITKLENANAGAWARLGASLLSLGKYYKAIEALKRSHELSAQPATMYNLGCAYARLNEKAQALEWLERSVAAGFNQPQAMSADADLASLRDEARFKAAVARAQANAKPCSVQPLNRQFDFWVGEWNVENPQGQPAGTSSVQLILGDCVVFENWTGAGGFAGKSFNFYNPQKGKWQQTWVDAVGGVLEFTGEYKDGKMLYTAETVSQNTKTLHRLTFFNLPTGRVRQLWEQSTDGGKVWSVLFDGTYVRKK